MKNIRIFIPDACSGIWLEVSKFFVVQDLPNSRMVAPATPSGLLNVTLAKQKNLIPSLSGLSIKLIFYLVVISGASANP